MEKHLLLLSVLRLRTITRFEYYQNTHRFDISPAGIDFDGGSRVCQETKLVDSDEPDAATLLNIRLRDIVHDMVRLGYI